MTAEEKARWRTDEENWWNSHGGHMTHQWELTPGMNRALRGGMDRACREFLLLPGGRLLDVGAGQGALALRFAAAGMDVLGIDLSRAQVEAAAEKARTVGLANARFENADVVDWDPAPRAGQFDRVFVNAFLHHLPPENLSVVLEKFALVLAPGGRLYLYEPLWAPGRRWFLAKAVDWALGRMLDLFVNRLPARLGWISARHREAMASGYTATSPREAAIDADALRAVCEKHFEVLEVRAWHLHSIGFAMQVMTLSDGPRRFYAPWAWIWYGLDRLLLALFPWESFSGPGRFILCSLHLRKK